MKTRNVVLLSAGHLITDINQGALPALLPFFSGHLHLSYSAVAFIVFAANASSTIIQPLFGYVADRFTKPWIMPLGIFLAGFGIALTGLLPRYELILVAAALSGVGVAAYHPQAARLVNLCGGADKATAMSFFGVGGTLGFAIGPLLATTAVLLWGLKGTVILVVPVTVMAIVLAVFSPRLMEFEALDEVKELVSCSDGPSDDWKLFARLTVTVVGRSILFYGLISFIPLYWIHVLEEPSLIAGYALTIMALAGVAGNIIGGKIADRIGCKQTILLALCILIPLLQALIWVTDARIAMLLLVPIGLSLSATYAPTIVLGQKYLPNHIGFSSGITLGVAVAIGGMAAPLLGMIADCWGLWSSMATLAGLSIVTVGTALTLREPRVA